MVDNSVLLGAVFVARFSHRLVSQYLSVSPARGIEFADDRSTATALELRPPMQRVSINQVDFLGNPSQTVVTKNGRLCV